MMQSLAREAQPYHPLHLSSKAATKLRYKLSILQALATHGLNTRNRIRGKASLQWQQASFTYQELLEDGLIEEILDRRDGNPIKITKKGKQALEAWYIFANAITGEESA